jgi:hypothetical protein
MHTRRLTVGLLAAAALVATPAAATAMPMLPDPLPYSARPLVETANKVAAQLGEEYAATHLRRLHTEMILIRHNPICAIG